MFTPIFLLFETKVWDIITEAAGVAAIFQLTHIIQ